MGFVNTLTQYAVPVIILVILSTGFFNNVKVYEAFLEGAKEGMDVVIKIVPTIIGLMVAIGIFRSSGALQMLVGFLMPFSNALNIPEEVLPIALLRPVSGSASLALLSNILNTHGADSLIGRTASTIAGSTETTFYTIGIYFGAEGIKNIRYTLIASLIADASSVLISVFICKIVF